MENSLEQFNDHVNTLEDSVNELCAGKPIGVVVPACLGVIFNSVLSAPNEETRQALIDNTRRYIDSIEGLKIQPTPIH